MNYREKDANPILFVLICAMFFLVLVSCIGVYFWLQSFRSMQLRNQAERTERRAKAEVVRLQRVVEEGSVPVEDTTLP